MGHLLLTSTGFFHQKVRNQFNKLISNKKLAVIITTASPRKEQNHFAIRAKAELEEMGFRSVVFLDIEKEPVDILHRADVIYINGGNPFTLLHYFKETEAIRVIQEKAKENCIIVGVSAGAVVLGSSIRIVEWFSPELNKVNLESLSAAQLFFFSIFPHADREDLFPDTKSIEERIVAFEKTSGEVVIRLADDDFKLIEI